MRPLAILALLVLPALLAPLGAPVASAALPDPFAAAIDVPLPTTGDQYRYVQTVDETFQPTAEGKRVGVRSPVLATGATSLLVDIEGTAAAGDRYGIERDVVTYRVRQSDDSSLLFDERCHMLQHSGLAVRHEYIVSPPDWWWHGQSGLGVGDQRISGVDQEAGRYPLVDYDYRSCIGFNIWGGETYREGESLFLYSPPLAPGMPEYVKWVASAPAQVVDFHGRTGLRFAWDVAPLVHAWSGTGEGTFAVTLVDGLAPIARVEWDVVLEDGRRVHKVDGTTELVGLSSGVGPRTPDVANTQLPKANPHATFAPHDRLAFDDEALRLAFPLREAVAAARGDPTLDLDEWLRERPDAVLVMAYYDQRMHDHLVRVEQADAAREGDGGWLLQFRDAGGAKDTKTVVVLRERGLDTPATGLAAPTPVVRTSDVSHYYRPVADAPTDGADLASSDTVAALVASEGVDPTRLGAVQFYRGAAGDGSTWAVLFASEIPLMLGSEAEEAGRMVSIELTRGMKWALATNVRAERSAGILAQAGGLEDEDGGALAALGGPAVGAGLAATGAATGLALLLLAGKFLLMPLYTRLRRDRLLDNPVRARLYDHVRAEPGIHLAQLVDFAGVGYGATRHHLAQLVQHRFLTQLDIDGYSRYYAAGEVPPALAREAALLRAPTVRAVYDLYASEPDLSLREAGRRLGVSAPSVHRAKKRLEKEGLLPARATEAAAVVVEA